MRLYEQEYINAVVQTQNLVLKENIDLISDQPQTRTKVLNQLLDANGYLLTQYSECSAGRKVLGTVPT